MLGPLVLGPDAPLMIADVVAVAAGRRPAALGPEVAGRMAAARAVVERAAAAGTPVYGLTTGLGAGIDTTLAVDDATEFQVRAVRARAVGVGPFLSAEEVRATLLVRLAGLTRGASGASPALAPALLAMLGSGIVPRVRRWGSIGEADLAPLADLFAAFAGSGEAEWEGAVLPAPEAFRRAGIALPPLGPKDGIALLNASSCTVALAALAVRAAETALHALATAGALSLEGFRANLSPLDPRAVALRPAPGQAEMAARLRTLLAGSDLLEPGAARRLQDPLSFRCLAPVGGVAILRLRDAAAAVEADLSGAGDSPAVLLPEGALVSTAGFDTTAIALALEALGAAMAQAATLSAARITQHLSPSASGLPRFLAPRGPSRAGFAPAGKTAAALESAIRHDALPLGALSLAVADGVEDYAPQTPAIVEKTRAMADRLARLAAVELAVAAAAVDLRGGARLGTGTAAAHRLVRQHLPPPDEDGPTGGAFEAIARAVERGALAAAGAAWG